MLHRAAIRTCGAVAACRAREQAMAGEHPPVQTLQRCKKEFGDSEFWFCMQDNLNSICRLPETCCGARMRAILIASIAVAAGVGVTRDADAVDDAHEIRVLSSRPETVTGGDALIGVSAMQNTDISRLRVFLDGTDVTGAFRPSSAGALVGLVEGIAGAGELRLASADGTTRGTLSLVNHPVEGPVFSGPHQHPFICETEAFELVSGETLGAPLDDACSIKRRIDYAYRSTEDGEMKPLAASASRPADLATAATLTGEIVPYIVRIETGTINRGIYQISMLHDPAADAEPDAWTAPPGWNGRLIYTFGGGCVNGWFRQGDRTGGVTDDWMLGQGYAVASSSLNVHGNNCNDVLAAETMMMVKERFIESYGVPRYTIGWGCSGGAYQSHQIADNYPGLLDGIIPGCSFPDITSSTIPMITDARLLNHYFEYEGTGRFTEEQQRAIAGFQVRETMPNVSYKAGRITVGEFCPDVLPESLRYHPTDNPLGARCDLYEHYVNVYGRDPVTGAARRPLDNVGVQYGLRTLNEGVISTAQFLHLNEHIGGYDRDGRFQAARTVANPDAVRIAYETGRVTNGGGGLATTPIIDYRAYSDDLESGDIHTRYHSFSMRERLRKANRRVDNHVMLVEDIRYGLHSSESPVLREALRQMDRWLEMLSADTSSDPLEDKVARAKPDGLTDACWSRDATPVKIAETQMRGSGRCEALYPSSPSPREVAGAPLTSDILKCRRKPVDLDDYAVRFAPDEIHGLRRIFPEGVCDWGRRGVGQTDPNGTWQTFR